MTLHIDSLLIATAMRPRSDASQAFVPSRPSAPTRAELLAIVATRKAH